MNGLSRISLSPPLAFIQSGETKQILTILTCVAFVLGFIGASYLQNIKDKNKKALYLHTLARKASAAKMGMTEKLKDFFFTHIDPKKYAHVFCEVRKDNLPA